VEQGWAVFFSAPFSNEYPNKLSSISQINNAINEIIEYLIWTCYGFVFGGFGSKLNTNFCTDYF